MKNGSDYMKVNGGPMMRDNLPAAKGPSVNSETTRSKTAPTPKTLGPREA